MCGLVDSEEIFEAHVTLVKAGPVSVGQWKAVIAVTHLELASEIGAPQHQHRQRGECLRRRG